jgi:hypothetical protein
MTPKLWQVTIETDQTMLIDASSAEDAAKAAVANLLKRTPSSHGRGLLRGLRVDVSPTGGNTEPWREFAIVSTGGGVSYRRGGLV